MNLLLPNQETKRLRFRLVKQSDFNDWLPMFEQPKVAEFLGLDESKPIQEICTSFFERVFSRYEKDEGGMNALTEKSTGKLIGQCGLMVQTINGQEYLEVGYAILPEFWGRGYASEASKMCMDYAFKNGLCETLISIINVGNIASERVAQKNGMRKVEFIPDYQDTQVNRWEIVKEEWSKLV